MTSTKTKNNQVGWEAAIRDAEKHIERLKGVIAACREKIKKGEPWPSESTATRN